MGGGEFDGGIHGRLAGFLHRISRISLPRPRPSDGQRRNEREQENRRAEGTGSRRPEGGRGRGRGGRGRGRGRACCGDVDGKVYFGREGACWCGEGGGGRG